LDVPEQRGQLLSVFRVDAAIGLITQIDTVPTEQQPRAFAIDPAGKFLHVVGEKSDSLTSYAIAPAGGKLRQYPIGKNCSEIVTLP
jgi:6-phosphogluconolactonase